MFSGVTNPRLYFSVLASGASVTALTIADLTLVVHRPGYANTALPSLTLVTDPTSTTVGAVFHNGGGLFWINISTASVSSYQGPINVIGTYVAGEVVPVPNDVSAYDPTGNPNTITPPAVGAIATAVWDYAITSATVAGSMGKTLLDRITGLLQTKAEADTDQTTIIAAINGLNDFDPASDTVARVTLVDTTTTNADMRGTNSAALAVTALSNLVWTNTKAGFVDAAISSVSAGGGGDATLAKQGEILAALGNVPDVSETAVATREELERAGGSIKIIQAQTRSKTISVT